MNGRRRSSRGDTTREKDLSAVKHRIGKRGNGCTSLARESKSDAPAIVSYHMVRKSLEGHAKQVLFYVHDSNGGSHLAIVGTDPRGTGHFTYESDPNFAGGPHVRCTNRSQVMSWLAELGAKQQVEMRSNHIDIAKNPTDESIRLTPSTSSRPLLARDYVDIRQENGRTESGHHTRNFYLVGRDKKFELLAIVGRDGPKKDRRYTYTSVKSLGCQTFENSKQCWKWLRWVIGQCDKPPIPRRDKRGAQKRQVPSDTGRASNKKMKTIDATLKPSLSVDCAFAENRDLLEWVTLCPDETTLQSFHEWAEKLGGIVIDREPEDAMTSPAASWTSTKDAIALLETIDSQKTCLKLLEMTRISRSIAMLKAHRDPQLAGLAVKVTAKWKQAAADALRIAKKALEGA